MATPRIDGYHDLQLIGRGGFAEVYRAGQPAFGNRTVAVKVLTVDGLDDAVVRRFERECHAAGRISWHPNVVNVYDAGATDDGRPYLVMEHLGRGSLADRLRDGPVPWQEAVTLTVPVAGALEAAHRAELVHRDVKPANVLVGPLDEPKLADFGIARIEDATASRTQGVRATVAHAAPEVLDGQAGPASDVYALASSLYELVAGSPAFVEPTDETLTAVFARILTAPVPDLRGRGVPAALAEVVEAGMAKDPADRPAGAAAFGEALQAAAERLGQPPVRMLVSLDEPPSPAPNRTPQAEPTVTVADAPSPPPPGDGGTVAAAASGGRARRTPLLAAAVVLVVLVLGGALVALLRGGGADDGGDREGGPSGTAVAAPAPGELTTIEVGARPLGVAVQGDEVFVAASEADEVDVLDATSGEVLTSFDATGQPRRTTTTDDGQVWVTFSSSGEVGRIDATGVLERVPAAGEPITPAAGFGSLWVTGSDAGTVTRIDLADTSQSSVLEQVGEDVRGVVAGGDAVWVTDVDGNQVVRIDPDDTDQRQAVTVDDGPGSVTFGFGAVWVASTRAGTVSRIDPDTLEVTDTVEVGAAPVAIETGAGAVWVTNQEDDTVSRLDPDALEVTDTVAVGAEPGGLAVTDEAVWVTDIGSNTVSRVALDPA